MKTFLFSLSSFSPIHFHIYTMQEKFLSIIYSTLFRFIHSLNAWKLSNFHKLLWWKFYSFIFLLFLSLSLLLKIVFFVTFFSWTEATHKFHFNYMFFMSGSWILAYLNDNFYELFCRKLFLILNSQLIVRLELIIRYIFTVNFNKHLIF